jgi:hypothetical protein
MANTPIPVMRPQDILVLLKLCLLKEDHWTQTDLAQALYMSQSEISASLRRSTYARLLYDRGRKVQRPLLIGLIQHGLPYVFPQQPGAVQRGFPTAHSAAPLREQIISEETYVWPSAKGKVRGHSIQPLCGAGHPTRSEAL